MNKKSFACLVAGAYILFFLLTVFLIHLNRDECKLVELHSEKSWITAKAYWDHDQGEGIRSKKIGPAHSPVIIDLTRELKDYAGGEYFFKPEGPRFKTAAVENNLGNEWRLFMRSTPVNLGSVNFEHPIYLVGHQWVLLLLSYSVVFISLMLILMKSVKRLAQAREGVIVVLFCLFLLIASRQMASHYIMASQLEQNRIVQTYISLEEWIEGNAGRWSVGTWAHEQKMPASVGNFINYQLSGYPKAVSATDSDLYNFLIFNTTEVQVSPGVNFRSENLPEQVIGK